MKKRRLTVKERAKVNKEFYFKLINAFIATNIVCFCALGYIYFRLVKYEEASPEGAIRNYLSLIENKNYKEVYEESKLVFDQFNDEAIYIEYLQEFYNDKTFKNARFMKQSYSDDVFLYYNIYDENDSLISNVQLKKIDDIYHVRTLTSIWNFDFDVINNLEFSINGVIVNNSYLTEDDVDCNAFNDIKNIEEVVKVDRYHLDNFVNIPDVKVSSISGIAVKDAINDQFYIGLKPTFEEKEEYENLILNVAQTYSKYITEDEKFYNLRKLLLRNTKFYQDISTFNNQWFSLHDSVEFKNIEIFDIVKLDNDFFIGSIKYDYEVKAGEKIQVYPTSYQIFFTKVNDNWLCTNLLLL